MPENCSGVAAIEGLLVEQVADLLLSKASLKERRSQAGYFPAL